MPHSLLRGRLQVQVLSGSPFFSLKAIRCARSVPGSCSSLRDFTHDFAEPTENTGTNPVQCLLSAFTGQGKENPGSAATETGVKANEKALHFPANGTSESASRSIAKDIAYEKSEVRA